MSYLAEEYYMIRTSKSHYYVTGSGRNATPKLYSRGHATRWCREFNEQKPNPHPDDGPYEVVPVRFDFGEPL